MAKVSARGAHKVGQVTTRTSTSRLVFALRSDGKVLRRQAGFYNESGDYTPHATGYAVWASLKPSEAGTAFTYDDVSRLAEILRRKGHNVIAIGR